jgi:predicted dehydrogenase
MTMDALRSGKDVYLEKPMTQHIEQSKEIAAEVKKTGRVLQVGAQWCSDPRYTHARDAIERGLIGKVMFAQSTYSMNSVYGVWQYEIEKEATPENIDWPAFLGSAPKRPFSAERYFRWRKYWDYGNGVISDFYYHRLAPMLVTLGGQFPTLVSAHGGIYQFPDREVPDTASITVEYEKFHINIACSSASAGPEKYHGPAIFGHEGNIGFGNGWILITPERPFAKKFLEKTGKSELRIECQPSDLNVIRVNHARNFFDCMRTRKKPVLDADLGYQAMVGIKLAADSYRQRRMLAWDPKGERLIKEAPPRPGYEGTGENYKEPA